MKPEVIRTNSFVESAARFIVDCAEEAIEERGHFRLSLSGGNTPKPVYQALSLMDCEWSKWIITFGDERCVPPDDVQSNYRMASESFLMVTTPGEVLRIRGEDPPDVAAQEYEEAVRYLARRFGEKRLAHDLILLGLGEDGHTASLFEGTEALTECERNVVSNFVPKFNTYRVTFTYPLINAARRVTFLVNDKKKSPIIEAILKGGSGYPAEGVKPNDGELLWFVGV
ncbi:MAG: 6-phosphogluconolactonase [Chthoniobacterales bacterium]